MAPPQQQISLRDSLYLSEDPNESTFKYDNQLPNLPVPTLEQSVFKLLDTIRPTVLEKQSEIFKQTEQKALNFIKDPSVNELQGLLKKRANTHKNWLEDWWLEFAYLRSRKPLVPYSNMAAPLPILSYWPVLKPGQKGHESIRAQRAALSTYFQLCFWRMLSQERMRPMIHKGVPWSMNQFKYLFNTVRRPGEPKDELVSWFKTFSQGLPESVEIIVLHRGYIFAIKPVTVDGTGQASILSAPQIESQLKYIENWCSQQPLGPGVGRMTTGERSIWKQNRDELVGVSHENKILLERIEMALSVLVLEDENPADEKEIFNLSMCGDPTNRWVDKSITSIAYKNGTFGASADHTPYDGFCTGIMTHYLITSVEECGGKWQDQMGATTNSSQAEYKNPELLEFQLSPQTKNSIHEAKIQFDAISPTIDTLHETFKHFGKALLKEHRFHPEAFVQCAIHSAYFRMHGKMAPAYVTASTRRFHNGRTETCRSCYPEMLDFVRSLSQKEKAKPSETYSLLKRSVERFQKLMEECSNGQGCDRHLLGLYLTSIFEGKKIPELFEDELVLKTNNYVLSTSCGGYWNVCGGVPPFIEDGYGCFYSIEDFAITFCGTAYKTSRETNLKAFYKHLTDSLVDMQKAMMNSKL